MRISRPNYDKMHRCPGWSGGGFTVTDENRCPKGRIQIDWTRPLWYLRTHRCNGCDVVVLPSVIRWLDPAWLNWYVRSHWDQWTYRG